MDCCPKTGFPIIKAFGTSDASLSCAKMQMLCKLCRGGGKRATSSKSKVEQPQCCFWQRLLIDLSSGQLACCKCLSICPKIAKIPAVKVSEIVHNDQWEETVWTVPQTDRQLQLSVESFGRQVRSSSDTHPLCPPPPRTPTVHTSHSHPTVLESEW